MNSLRRVLLIIAFLSTALFINNIVLAHANPLHMESPSTSALDAASPEIKMWFSELLEPSFGKINLSGKDGNILNTLTTQIGLEVPSKIITVLGRLPGRVRSLADGHSTTLGSYPIVIGDASLLEDVTNQADDAIRLDSILIRWMNLISLALTTCSIGFFLFTSKPTASRSTLTIERHIIMWAGWIFIGVTGFLLLVLHYSFATGNPILVGISGTSLNSLIADTLFGHLWLLRTTLWTGLGGALWFARTNRWFYLVSLVLSGIILICPQ